MNRINSTLSIFLFFLFLTPGYSQYESLLHKSYAERYIPVDTIFYFGNNRRLDSVAAFAEIDKLRSLAIKEKDRELTLEADALRADYYMMGKQGNLPDFENRMLKVRQTADDEGILQLQIRTRQMLGFYYCFYVKKLGLGFENYLDSYYLMKNVTVANFPNKQELTANVGSAYYHIGDTKNAKKYLAEAQTIPGSYKRQLSIAYINTFGLIYRNEGKLDSAEFYFRKAYQMAEASGNRIWMGISAGNIGITYFNQKRYPEAIPLLELDVRESFKANELDNGLNSLIKLLAISLEQKNYEKASAQIKEAFTILPKTLNAFQHKSNLYPLLAKYYAVKNNHRLAYIYSDSVDYIKDSLYIQKNAVTLARAEQKVAVEQHQNEIKQLAAKESHKKIIVYSIIVVVVLIGLIAILFLNRQRLLLKQKQIQLQAAKTVTESELQIALTQMYAFIQNIQDKNQLLEKVSSELQTLQAQTSYGQEPDQEMLMQLQKTVILTDEQWENFKQMFEVVHPGFLNRLKQKLPGLSPTETRYIVLSKLQLTPKEMAALLGIRPDGIRLHRHRIRKKLNLDEENALEDLINTI